MGSNFSSTFEKMEDVLNVRNACQVVNHVGGNYEGFVKINKIVQTMTKIIFHVSSKYFSAFQIHPFS